MKRFLHIIIISLAILCSGVVLSQSRDSYVAKTPEEVLVAKNRPENVLFAGEEFVVQNVYPNPADAHISLEYSIPNHITNVKFEIRNILGNVVSAYSLTPGSNHVIKISTANLDQGIYFHSLYLNNKNLVTRKLVIKR